MSAVEAAAGSIDVVLVVVTLLGGLAIFLLGLDQLTDSLKIVAGNQMRAVLERFTGNRFAGLATGAGQLSGPPRDQGAEFAAVEAGVRYQNRKDVMLVRLAPAPRWLGSSPGPRPARAACATARKSSR